MSFHKWRRVPTKHFGDVWVPFAQVHLEGADGTLHALALQIDSGAVVSLLGRSIADLLGLQLEAGQKVELASVGGKSTTAFVHSINTTFAKAHPAVSPLRAPIRFAIATNDAVPNLLGRLDVFDVFQVDFDPSLTQAGLLPNWLDGDERRDYDFLIDTEQHILARWGDMALPQPAPEACRRLVNHMGQLYACAVGLLKLHRPYSTPLYVRTMLETWMPLEYLLQDPGKRATLYLEFEHVTRHKQSQAIANNPTGPIADRVAKSDLRVAGEKRNRQEYARVRSMFQRTTRAGNTKDAGSWYMMKVAELASALGHAGEYRVMYAHCSAWAHADPSQTGDAGAGMLTDRSTAFALCTSYYARMLKSIADAGKIILSGEQYDFLDQLSHQWH